MSVQDIDSRFASNLSVKKSFQCKETVKKQFVRFPVQGFYINNSYLCIYRNNILKSFNHRNKSFATIRLRSKQVLKKESVYNNNWILLLLARNWVSICFRKQDWSTLKACELTRTSAFSVSVGENPMSVCWEYDISSILVSTKAFLSRMLTLH